MATKLLRAKSYADFSKGNWQAASESLVPENSVKLGLNFNTDEILGEAVSRLGTTLVHSQLIDNKPVLGLHNYRDSVTGIISSTSPSISPSTSPPNSLSPSTSFSRSPSISPSKSPSVSPSVSPSTSPPNSVSPSVSSSVSPSTSPPNSVSPSVSPSSSLSPSTSPSPSPPTGGASRLFAVLSDGTNNDIYDVATGLKSLEDDTKDLKTRFLTYLNSCLRLNGTDAPKAWNGTTWLTSGGTFDLANMPQTSKYAIEFRDRVYVAGRTDYPDRVDISGIASSTTRAVSWISGNTFIVFEQEDGGGGITGLAKVPGYVLVFKKRTLKRWDGSSAYPEDMVNQGAPSQEAIVTAKGICFWVNENGAWASTGGDPKKIDTYTVEKIIKSCSSANLANVASGTDEQHVFWSFASVTMDGVTYTNIVLKYNIFQNTWDIRQYPTLHRVYARYIDSADAVFTIVGDDDGNVLKLDTGNDDNGTPIYYSLEFQDWTFGFRTLVKAINRVAVVTEKISNGSFMWRNSSRPEDWIPIGTIDKEVVDFNQEDLRGVMFNFKISGSTDSGQVRVKSVDFIEGVKVLDVSSV